MKPTPTLAWSTGAVALLSAFLLIRSSGGLAQPTANGLEGARPAIDAANYPTLQDAINALPKTGGVLRLPAGEFEIREPLTIQVEDVCVEGAGTATHIKNMNTDGKPAIVLEHPEGAAGNNRLWRIRLANFRVTGNEKSGHGIDARRINEVFLDGVTVSYHGGDGVRLDYCYEDPRVCDCLITYNKAVGVNLLGCHDIVVSANQFEENQDALHCKDGFNLTMTGNNLDDHLGHGVIIENTYGSVVSGNMIEECAGTAMILDRDCYGITLSANVIAHNGAGIDLRDAHGCAVSANTFTLMKTDALNISAGSGRIAVTGNCFCDSYIGEGKVRRATDDLEAGGVRLAGASDVALSGNVFSRVRPKALSLEGEPSRRVLFSNNVLTQVESDHQELEDSMVRDNIESKSAGAQ